MTLAEVTRALGERLGEDGAGLRGEAAFRYPASHVRVVTREDRAVEFALVPPAKVLFEGRSLFEDHSVWRDIVAADGNAQVVLGFVVLQNLGLTLTGFHDGDDGQLAVTAFEQGRWRAP